VGSRTPLRLTNDPADDRDPAWSPNGRNVALASHRDGNWEIYVEDVNNPQNIQRMTYDLSFQGHPAWSPDGEWLVYESYQGNNLDVYIMKADLSQPALRLPGNSDQPDFSPSWSPDGRRIAFISWRDGNQDIYVFSLNDQTTVNLTATPDRDEDTPTWSPDGKWIAYSAIDGGLEKVFVKAVDQPDSSAQVIAVGHNPSWSPDGSSLVFAVDSPEDNSTQLIADPFAGTGGITPIIPVQLGATQPVWTAAPLPQAMVNSGGLGPAVPGPLFVEQEQRFDGDAPYKFNSITDVQVQSAFLSDRVNDSFNALRQRALQQIGWDFLGKLDDAFWPLDRAPQPGEERRSWHMAGRAFSITRSSLLGFPAPVEVVREDLGVDTYWRVYVRVSDDAQTGQLGEPLRQMPWNFAAADQGDVQAYDQGGRRVDQMPEGYFVDFTAIAADYDWDRAAAGTDWRANSNSRNFWEFERHDGLSWYEAMRELYSDSQLGGFAPTATPLPTLIPTASGS
jgi:TolB protein